ncbi:MAG: phosphotransferase [Pseudomonadota bacterium]
MSKESVPGNPFRAFLVSFLKETGFSGKDIRIKALAGDGSKRSFWRISHSKSGISFIAMENTPEDAFSKKENLAYLRIGEHLFRKGLPVPEIHRYDLGHGWFIMEDMGEKNLQETVFQEGDKIQLYEKVDDILFRLQVDGSRDFSTAWCCQTERYDHFVMRRYESDYFRDAFLSNYLGLKKDWPELEGPFNHVAEMASRAENHFFLHRDFQSRNIIVNKGEIGIVDWQGGRLGPLGYDLASLLIDPYVELSAHEKNQIRHTYLQILKKFNGSLIDPFKRYFPYLAIQRNLQILGAFSYLSKIRGKPYFEAYIPPAVRSLRSLLDELADVKLGPLMEIMNALIPSIKM